MFLLLKVTGTSVERNSSISSLTARHLYTPSSSHNAVLIIRRAVCEFIDISLLFTRYSPSERYSGVGKKLIIETKLASTFLCQNKKETGFDRSDVYEQFSTIVSFSSKLDSMLLDTENCIPSYPVNIQYTVINKY